MGAVIPEPLNDELAWQTEAACLGSNADLWFPERGASTAEAKQICAGCAVREQCLAYALRAGIKFGVWGGLSERERRRIRTQRRLAATKHTTPASDATAGQGQSDSTQTKSTTNGIESTR